MPFVERLLDLVLMRHRLKASKPYLLELMGALTLLISLVMFAMVSLSLILFVGLWLAFKLMVMLGLGNVSAGIFILVGVVVMGIGVVALISAIFSLFRASPSSSSAAPVVSLIRPLRSPMIGLLI